MRITLLVLMALVTLLVGCAASPTAHFDVQVRGKDESPVEGVRVSGGFVTMAGRKDESDTVKAFTDRDGMASISGKVNDSSVNVGARKDGYYTSIKEVGLGLGLEQKVTIYIREKKNPISMYARKSSPVLPGRSKEYGFDFFAGDLAVEGHSGTREDILFRVERPRVGEKYEDYEQVLTVSFPGEKDGIQFFEVPSYAENSEFKSDHKAPESGYEDEATIKIGRKDGHRYTENIRRPAYLRIRSTVDEDGNLESAHYCKIYPGFFIGGGWADTARVDVPFYCNPHKNDRGMEFDTGNSLFRDLKGEEHMRQP